MAGLRPGVAIIAGGLGTRLRPVTGTAPKALAPFAGGTLLSHLLERVAPLNPARVVLLAGYEASTLRACAPAGVEVIAEPSPLGTAGALAQLPPEPRTWLSLNVDHVSDLDLRALLAAHDGRATAVTTTVEHEIPQGVVQVQAGRLQSWQERPRLSLQVTVGAYVFDRAALAQVLHGQRMDMPELISALAPVQAFHHGGRWFDAGTPQRLAAAEVWYQAQRSPSPAT